MLTLLTQRSGLLTAKGDWIGFELRLGLTEMGLMIMDANVNNSLPKVIVLDKISDWDSVKWV